MGKLVFIVIVISLNLDKTSITTMVQKILE